MATGTASGVATVIGFPIRYQGSQTVPDFIEERFPTDLAYASSGGPAFNTFVFDGFASQEYRAAQWEKVKYKYVAKYGERSGSALATLRKLFMVARGKAVGFRFRDWQDYELVDEVIGTGDGTTKIFNIIKTYDTNAPYTRRIHKLVIGTVVVKVDGVTWTPTTQYTVNLNTGVITFTNAMGATPILDAVITVSCQFDVPVRFDTNEMSASYDEFDAMTWDSIPLVEIRLED